MDKELNKKMMSWISGKDTGLSSITLWSAIMHTENHSPSIPYDPADFGRCWRLLRFCDETTKEMALKEVASRYEIWIPFVKYWKDLTKLFESGKVEELSVLLKAIRPF